jgi:hypothetical protein
MRICCIEASLDRTAVYLLRRLGRIGVKLLAWNDRTAFLSFHYG